MAENMSRETPGEERDRDAAGITDAEREAEFEKLINGEFREAFRKKMQGIIDKRFRKTKETEEKLRAAEEKLNGMGAEEPTPQTPYEGKETAAQEEASEDDEVGQRYASLMGEAEEVKRIYPEFDIREAVTDERFSELLAKGVDMQSAYELCHRDELIKKAMRTAAAKAAEMTVKEIRAKGLRPLENAAASRSPAADKTDVAAMSKRQREDIARRVMRGEKIRFK